MINQNFKLLKQINMQQYLRLLQHIMDNGIEKSDRTGTGTKSVFGYQMRFDLQDGFPLVTTKKLHLRSIIYELLWFLKGDTNIGYLKNHGVSIWDEWANENGDLGPVYGKQWRSWEGKDGEIIDQISSLIDRLKTYPDCRRLIVSAWNVGELSEMALMPCHCLFQFYTREMNLEQRQHAWAKKNGRDASYTEKMSTKDLDKVQAPRRYLDCQLYQRSCDTLLGVPFNIASYALLIMMIAQVVNMEPGEFVWTGGDVHIYKNHFDQVETQLLRDPYPLPIMEINPTVKDIFSFNYEDFSLRNYQSHPAIKAPIAV